MGTYLGRLCPYPPPWVLDGQHSVTLPTNWPAMTTCCACISIYFKAILHYVCASLAAMLCSLIPEIVFQDPKGPVPFLGFLSSFCTCCLQRSYGQSGKEMPEQVEDHTVLQGQANPGRVPEDRCHLKP